MIPAEVEEAGARTTAQALARAAERWPDRLALLIDGTRLSWAALHAEARAAARGLRGLGIGPGDHVALLLGNSADYVRLIYAASMLGATAVTLNARMRGEELRYVIGHSDARLLVTGGHALPHVDYRGRLTELFPTLADWDGAAPLSLAEAPRLERVLSLADPAGDWPGEAALSDAAVPEAEVARLEDAADADAPALMMFSSGTTARPKACLLSHRTIGMAGAALARRMSLTPEDRIYNPLPFFHMSTMLPMAACRASGAGQICTLHFEPGAAIRTMEEERASFAYTSFPTLVSQIVGHPSFDAADLSAVRLFHCVGPPDLMRRYADRFPNAAYINAYGLTEATGVPVWTVPEEPRETAFATSGRPFDGMEAKAVHPETGADLPPGETGEILLRGYCLFMGYYKDPDGTAKALRPDGWLRTGDLGHLDPEGRVVFDGRLKDMLKIGGENVAALEIEAMLNAHPQVRLAQVIGVPDERLTEVAAAFVEPEPGAALDPAELAAWCAGRIAGYKLPRYIRLVTDWPMSATKIQKFRLPRDFAPSERIEPR